MIDARPAMTEREASWHETVAGIRAAEAAQREGSDPRAAEALLDADTPVMIGGREFYPPSAGVVWLLRSLDSMVGGLPADVRTVATAWIFADRRAARDAMRRGTAAFQAAVQEWGFDLSFPDLRRIEEQIIAWMRALQDGEGRVGKPEAGVGETAAGSSNPSPDRTPADTAGS